MSSPRGSIQSSDSKLSDHQTQKPDNAQVEGPGLKGRLEGVRPESGDPRVRASVQLLRLWPEVSASVSLALL